MAARQKNDSGTSAAFHPRKQHLTEWPVLVLNTMKENKEVKNILCLKKKTNKNQKRQKLTIVPVTYNV